MEGHAKVAQLMSQHPELAIARRFSHLNMQNLLYLQAELAHLEVEYRNIAEANQRYPERLDFAKDWFSLSQSNDEADLEQWEKFLEIRGKLKEYSILSKSLNGFLLCSPSYGIQRANFSNR